MTSDGPGLDNQSDIMTYMDEAILWSSSSSLAQLNTTIEPHYVSMFNDSRIY